MKNHAILISLLLLTACSLPHQNLHISDDRINIALKKHNTLRQLHFNDSALIYSEKLEKDAQRYANNLAKSGVFQHDSDNKKNMYGENLYAYSANSKPDLASIIQKWYDEKKYYNYNTKRCQSKRVCGHYTQIIWKRSKLLGCASAQYKRGRFKNGYVTVCKYYPYGNIVGKDPY